MNRVAKIALSLALLAGNVLTLDASENLRLNPKLDYSSDSLDGRSLAGITWTRRPLQGSRIT